MTDDELVKRNQRCLKELHEPFALKVKAVLKDLQGHGYRPRIQEGYRTEADQLKAFDGGFSKLIFGKHNITLANGIAAACAADITDDDDPVTPSTRFFLMLASSAWAHELVSGTLWGLTPRQQAVVKATVEADRWSASVRIGWDPYHVEVPTRGTARALQTAIRKGLA